MFTIGFILPTTELQLIGYGVKEADSGFWFSINTFGYAFSCIIVSFLPKSLSKPLTMLFGMLIMTIAFIIIGPSPLFFNPHLNMTGIGLGLIGFSCGFIYGNIYIVPSIPHMIEIAQSQYNYSKDDRLNDALLIIANMSLCVGEIMGPIAASLLYSAFGYGYASTIIAFTTLFLLLIYLFKSDACQELKVEDKSGNEKLIEMQL